MPRKLTDQTGSYLSRKHQLEGFLRDLARDVWPFCLPRPVRARIRKALWSAAVIGACEARYRAVEELRMEDGQVVRRIISKILKTPVEELLTRR